MGAFFEGNGTAARDLAADVAVDGGGGCGDRVEEFDASAFFHPKIPAMHSADDFSVAADDEISGTFDRAGEFAEHGEVVAAERGTCDDAGFLDDYIAASLDTAVPVVGDFIVKQADVTAAFRALTGLCLGDGGKGVSAIEATDITGWLERKDQAF